MDIVYCGKIEKIIEGEKYIVPAIENVKVEINPNPKDDSEYYIVLD